MTLLTTPDNEERTAMPEAADAAIVARRPKETLERFLAAVQAGDFEAVAGYFSPRVVVHEPADLVVGGEHTGFDGWAAMMTKFGQTYDLKVSSYEIVEAGDRALLMMAPTFIARGTGRYSVVPVIEVYQFADGLIVDVDVYYKEPGALAGLLAP
jgi:ketosteroid isomerase-like protein